MVDRVRQHPIEGAAGNLQAALASRPYITRRSLLAAGSAATLGIALGACNSESKGSDTLTLLDRSSGAEHDKFVKWLVARFNAENDLGVKVNVSFIPVPDWWTRGPLALRGSNPPDIVFGYQGGWLAQMIEAGWAEPLDPYFSKYDWDSTLVPVASSDGKVGNKRYLLPWYLSAAVTWYNPDIYNRLNLDVPTSYTQLLEQADTLKRAGVAPFMVANQRSWEAQFMWTAYYVNKHGADTYRKLVTNQIPWTDPTVVEAMEETLRWHRDGLLLEPVNGMDFDTTAMSYWRKGDAAIWYQGSFLLQKFIDDGKLLYPIDWYRWPQTAAGVEPTVSIWGEEAYMINRRSKNKDAAAAFLDWVVSKKAQARMLQEMGPYPVRNDVSFPGKQPELVDRLWELLSTYSGESWAHVDRSVPPSVSDPFLKGLQTIIGGSSKITEALETVQAAAERA